MIRAWRFELVKLRRRRPVVLGALLTTLFAVGATALVLAGAEPAGPGRGSGPTRESLATAGGGTEAFTTACAFAGFFVLVAFTGAVAVEFGRGNVRTMVLRQPRRLRLLAGKLVALLTVAAVLLAGAEVLGWVTARLLAPSQDIDTSRWTGLDALGAAAGDYGTLLLWVSGYAVLGTALAVLVRSVPVSLAIGIAWAGPFEHILADAWDTGGRIFPGLQLETFVAGGRDGVGAGQALAVAAGYAAVAAAMAALAFSHRDVT
jgi:ABC-2 type transport system permease protein